MEERIQGIGTAKPIQIADPHTCHLCGFQYIAVGDSCSRCGFPQYGSQKEMRAFIREVNGKKLDVEQYLHSFKSVRYLLFSIAVMDLSLAIFFVFFSKNFEPMVISLFSYAFVFGLLGLLATKKPLLSSVFAFILFMGYNAYLLFALKQSSAIGYWDFMVFFTLLIAIYYAFNHERTLRYLRGAGLDNSLGDKF